LLGVLILAFAAAEIGYLPICHAPLTGAGERLVQTFATVSSIDILNVVR